MTKYTKEQLIFYLKKLSLQLKRSPLMKDMDKNKKMPSSSTYMKRFGSWNSALRKAGLKVTLRKTYTKKELSENLRMIAKEIGQIPKASDLSGKKWTASYSTYRKYFGSWKNALLESGLKSKRFTDLKSFSSKRKR